jgi:uncharacterized protein YycO
MELTGKTLKDFWIWYLLPEQRKAYKTSSLRGVDNVAKIRFLAMSFTERYGVYVDFFDSVGILIENGVVWDSEISSVNIYEYNIKNQEEKMYLADGCCNSLLESRKEAIEKANEIYNLNQ